MLRTRLAIHSKSYAYILFSLPIKMEKLLWLVAVVTVAFAADGPFNYVDQDAWGGDCTSGKRQSPVDISLTDVKEGGDLIDLVLEGWEKERTGTLRNTGSTVKFEPDDDESFAETTNHKGTYKLLQFHLHWGDANNVGSEHLVDGKATSAEIHFVHRNPDEPAESGDAFAVVGVRVVVDEGDETPDYWNELSVKELYPLGANTSVTVRYSDFLPADLSYYFYEGSLTTPNCDEIVLWFLLQDTISVPRAYLEQLRKIENEDGEQLTFNFREPQALNDRTVYQHTSSGLAVKPVQLLTALSLVAVMIFSRL